MKYSKLFREVFWLVLILVISTGVSFLPYGNMEDLVDLQIHDTYFMITRSALIFSLFIFLFALLIPVRILLKNSNNFTYWINYVMIFLAEIHLLKLAVYSWPFLTLFGMRAEPNIGWTVYPPLIAIPKEQPVNPVETMGLTAVILILFAIQLYILLGLAITVRKHTICQIKS